jgi:hypothetical protein
MNSYDTLYGVGLLDDLHNYFPALLYDHGHFNSVQQVLQYVRMQMAQRFNLYSYGQEQFRTQQQPTTSMPVPIWTVPQTPFTQPPPLQRSVPFEMPGQQQQQRTTTDVVSLWDEGDINFANELLRMLGTSFTTSPALGGRILRGSGQRLNPNANPWTPVIVRPTRQVIEENSEILTGVSGSTCAICQDGIESSACVRRLRACQHTYHQICIDTWFQESVHCPTCRHDIRVSATSAFSSRGQPQQQNH